jgi:surfeit locus 1 family protein
MTPQRAAKPVALCAALLVLAILFCALANWQVQRLHWKEALIARMENGMKAAPLPVGSLPGGDLQTFEYRRVAVSGTYLARGTVLVTGTSGLGSGYWVLVPLKGDAGTVYVNRGFVPLGTKLAAVRVATPKGTVAVTGLLRLAEPGGSFLRDNRPKENRWYSRDVAGIAGSGGIPADPRFFVDASIETPASTHAPIAELTVVSFPNNHLAYALTWATLAALSIGAAFVLWQRPT